MTNETTPVDLDALEAAKRRWLTSPDEAMMENLGGYHDALCCAAPALIRELRAAREQLENLCLEAEISGYYGEDPESAIQCFSDDVQEFNRARERAGGDSPVEYIETMQSELRAAREENARLRAALEAAATFIEEELQHRRDSFMPTPTEDELDCIDEAMEALVATRAALAPPAPESTKGADHAE